MKTSFEQSIEQAEQLIRQLEVNAGTVPERELLRLVESQAGARGFFVALLTGEWIFDDTIPEPIITILKEVSDTEGNTVNSLLTKNLVMPTCMRVKHEKDGDGESAAGSRRVIRRVKYLLARLRSAELTAHLSGMLDSINSELDTDTGQENRTESPESINYRGFLNRWKYNRDQLEAARIELREVLEK